MSPYNNGLPFTMIYITKIVNNFVVTYLSIILKQIFFEFLTNEKIHKFKNRTKYCKLVLALYYTSIKMCENRIILQ